MRPLTYSTKHMKHDILLHVGACKEGKYLTVLHYGYSEKNATTHLNIINTCLKKNHDRRWNWWFPNGKHKNEIDCIIRVLSNQRKIFQNFEVMNLKIRQTVD